MPFIENEPSVKRQKVEHPAANPTLHQRASRIFAPFRTIGLVSPTAVPFTAIPLGKKTFQITTSVGRSLQTYDLRRGLNLVFITRPQTPGLITASASWADKVLAAWSAEIRTEQTQQRGIWIFKRGNAIGKLHVPRSLSEDVVQIIVLGAWIVGCCSTRIEVWNSTTYEHYTTILPQFDEHLSYLTGGICSVPTFVNKLLAGRQDGTVELWNVSTGKLLFTIQPPSSDVGPVTALQPTTALSLVAIAYSSGLVVIQDIELDQEITRLQAGKGPEEPITSISFRTDGFGAGEDGKKDGVMVTASFMSGDLVFWDLNEGGRKMGTLYGAHNSPTMTDGQLDGGIAKVEFLSGQAVMLSSGLDNSLKSWIFDEEPFSPIPRLLSHRGGHAAPINTVEFLPSDADGTDAGGKWLLTSSQDRSFWGWSLRRDGQSSELSQGRIAKKTKRLAATLNGRIDSVSNQQLISRFKAPPITCIACCLNRDGGIGAMPGVRTLWATAKQLKASKATHTEQNLTGWESIVTGHENDKHARTWFWGRKRAGRWLLETSDGGSVTSVAISPCGTFAIIGSDTGSVDMYNLQSGLHRQHYPARLTKHRARRLHDPEAYEKQRLVERHAGRVTGLCVDNLNSILISCGSDGKIKFWSLMDGKLQHETNWGHRLSFQKLVHQRSSDLVALSSDDHNIRIIDLNTRKLIRQLEGCTARINDFCFSNDSRWIVAASEDALIRVWELTTGHLVDAIRLTRPCSALAFSNTGEYLAVAQENSIGIDIWTNRTLFTHVHLRQLSADEFSVIEGPTASGEGGQGALTAAFDEVEITNEVERHGSLPTLDQLAKNMTTLSIVPKSRWQTLLYLDAIRERNKPQEPPKAPEKAPFFLSSTQSAREREAVSVSGTDKPLSPAQQVEQTHLVRVNGNSSQSSLVSLLHGGNLDGSHEGLFHYLKALAPATAELEIRSLNVSPLHSDLTEFITALSQRLDARKDYELVQAWMAVFLKCHGEVLEETENTDSSLFDAMEKYRSSHSSEASRLNKLAGYCSGTVGFMRSAK